jgi:hypothetical protein
MDTKISADTLEIGAIHFGKSQLKEAVVKELERRRVEVAATGEAAWCRYQRVTMLGEGLTDLFR